MTTAAASILPGSLRAWLIALRPRTLPAALVPVAVGSACAARAGGFAPKPALAALAGALALQIASNLANDVADFERGADGAERVGPPRAAQNGWLSPVSLKLGAMTALALALASGVYLASIAGPAIVVLGTLSMVAAVAYTAGPWPLAYHGLGEAFVLVFFGFVAVCGTAYVQLGRIPAGAWPAALAVGALATALLVVNNLRDIASDAAVDKRTLAVRFGERFAVIEYSACLGAAFAVPPLLLAIGAAGPLVLAPLATLPLAIALVRRVARERGASLNLVLAHTARLLALFGLLLAAGVALGGSPS